MLTVYDPHIHALVVVCPAAEEYPTEQHEAFLTAVRKLDHDGAAHGSDIVMMVVLDPKSPPPSARWRQRYAETRAACRSRRVYSTVVTESAVLRGVLTALNWLKQPPPHVITMAHGSVQESRLWIESLRGRPQPELLSLYEKGRAQLRGPLSKAG